MRSTFGEWSGNVRSTPTPNDCLRTVNVSRTPGPWRLMTVPSKTWIREREPSITRKCTFTVSPALNCGRSLRSWRCSSAWITLLIGKDGREGRVAMLAKESPRPRCQRQHEHEAEEHERRSEADPQRRPIDEEHLADDVVPRDGPPLARVARCAAVVSHEEVLALRDLPRRVGLLIAA